VIAKEMSPSWASAGGGKGAQALQAQAVAARSYALAENRDPAFKTCDQVCQFYAGAAYRSSIGGAYVQVEYPSTDAAVQAVAGIVRRVGNTGGQIAYTMFAASSGGWTMPGPGGQLPFPAVPDDGDDTSLNPNHNWSVTFTGSQIVAKYPSIGTFTGISILSRNGYGDWGGRVTSMRVDGTAGSVTVTGDAFKSAMGLKSNWFAVHGQVSEPPPTEDCGARTPPTVTGGLPAAPGAEFTPISPLRLIDTRSGVGTADLPLGAGCTLVVDPGLGDGVTAVAINLTAVRPTLNGYLTAYPCGTPRPNVSAVQAIAWRPVAGMAVVPLGAAGTICVFSSITTELVVDLFGSYAPDSGVPYEPITAVRLKDTRNGAAPAAGTIVQVPVVKPGGAPAGSTAAALTVHVTDASGDGWATVYPCSATVPTVSSLNTVTGSSVTNHVEVSLSGSGEVCVFVSTEMHVVVDLSGWYGPTASTEFFALDPFRAIDTRNGTGLSGAFTAGSNRAITLAGSGGLPSASTLRAVMAEVTAVAPSSTGYLTVHPCLPAVPGLSMVRYTPGANFANPVASPDDASGRWCIAASATTHVLVDVSGYFA
ncbi:MAG TPA: SpoIID/LytB domain-containing protein, partial [Ilumatobacteraceae bacterium]|nr:SpoIID/LytB domain-containing protein [Ilumatobacteraceae bacterium]